MTSRPAAASRDYHRRVEPLIDVKLVRGPVRGSDAVPDNPADVADSGGECVFIGRTRGERHPDHGRLAGLGYEAYEPMAVGVISGIARRAAELHRCAFIGVRHSIGLVPVGAPSVLVRVLAGHRAEAFAACREVIDRLKGEAPIWKHERWEQGESWQRGTPVASTPTEASA